VTHAQEGALGVAALSGDADGAEIGVMLLPHAQGRGHAVECIQRLVLHAFEELGLPRVFTRHADAHTRALGLMRKLGFAPVPPTGSGEPACRWERKRP
jgi:RimJ/RimL family protein N-acetyltransferase